MKRLFFFTLIILVAGFSIRAQFSRTNNEAELRLSVLQKAVAPLYRRPTDRELKSVSPDLELSRKHAEFLRQANTGLTKLINDKGCAENTKIIVATDECLKYTMPGGGSSYSFRLETYRIPRLADLTYTDNSFQSAGVLLHGIFVNIGDVPLEQVTRQTEGLKYLIDFQPETEYEKAKKIDRQLTEGIGRDGFLYRRGLYVTENATFVLRSIAYAGKLFRSVKGITYNEFDFDKRKDVIVAFRIVEKDSAGNITILWRKIQEKEAPKVKKNNAKTAKSSLPISGIKKS